jgi:O-antigen ligase
MRPVQALIAAPALVFLATLAMMLFRPANLGMVPFDRIAFCLLVFVVLMRVLLLREKLPVSYSFTLPMLALATLAVAGSWHHSYDAEMWSVVAAQFVVPFAMFHLAQAVFTSTAAVRQLEAFSLLTLAYLCFISVAFLLGQTQLIFPRFILDQQIEMHADRARGPFLQAVANGVALNLLGLLVFDLYRRKRLGTIAAGALLVSLPLAIFATMTRSVWLSSVLSFSLVAFIGQGTRVRRLLLLAVIPAALVFYMVILSTSTRLASQERLEDRGTVDFRLAVSQLSWDMFREKPLLGWGQGEFAREIETRMSEFRPETYAAHNTFLDVLVEHGAVGLVLYLWILVRLFSLSKGSRWLQFTWPICLGVYLVNACCVVMNYQFVNALLFTFAGVIACQKERVGQEVGAG